jgi:type I restriction enzyme S subunit
MGTKYKDSGIPWVGTVPDDWSSDVIGNLFSPRKERVSDKDYPPLSVGKMGVVPQLKKAVKSDHGDYRKLVKVGDFVINGRSDRRGSCGISSYEGSVSLKSIVLTPRGEMDSGYLNWLFHTEQFADEFHKWGHGIVDDLWATKWDEMKRISIPIPPLPVQKCITYFLDKKCREIDELTELQETMIAELKRYRQSVVFEAVTKGLDPEVPMKDSGVKCVGKIPSHWSVVPVPLVFDNLDCLRKSILVDDRERCNPQYDYYGVSGIIDRIDHYNVEDKVLLIGQEGTNLRRRNLPLVYKAEGRFWVSDNVHILKPRKDDYDYMALMLETLDYTDFLTGSTLPILSQENLAKVKVCVPPLNEQRAIADYLDRKCSEIDELIATKQRKIGELDEYRKSVIFECVTGKKEVF